MRDCFLYLLVVALGVTSTGLVRAQTDGSLEPADYVDPFVGTSGSRWMLYPGPSMPFGMVKLSPDNQDEGWKAGYEYTIKSIHGFSHLHSWTMGGLLTMPVTGPLKTHHGAASSPPVGWTSGYRSRFWPETETAAPGYYAVTLHDYDIRAEMTTTTRTGFQRYTFPEADEARILFDFDLPTEYGVDVEDAVIRRVSDTEIEGYVEQKTADYNEYILHFVARLSRPFESMGGWVDDEISRDLQQHSGSGDVGVFLDYQTDEGDVIQLQTGISLVSIEQARLNLETELAPFTWDFQAAREQARATWNDLLGTIQVEGGTENDRRKFYTNMYRSYAARTIWSDVDGRYVDMCEEVAQLEDPESPVYGADAFWNTFWNLNQLWTLATPDIANKWVRSLIEIYDRGGWLPKGPTGIEYSSIMVASHEIPLMVSAYQKGIRNYDVDKAYEAMRHNQMEPGRSHECGGHVGNRNLAAYKELGYVPYEDGPVSNTLEYAYDDWTVSQMAKALGNEEDHRYFSSRAANYKNVFYPGVGYVWMRHENGEWVDDFDAYCCTGFRGHGFVEGNAWQYTWFVPHDLAGLIELLGGRDVFNERLIKGFEKSSRSNFNAAGDLFDLVPVNHGNQPNMQAAYLFNYSGMPWQTQYWVREIMDRYYGVDPYDGWLGDEDQGQMGAWYVMSAMGLFEMRGGAAAEPTYEIGSPLFDKVTIQLDETYYPGGTFVIEAPGVSSENRYVQSATLDGEPLGRPWFYHRDLVDGGRLVLEMGPEPNEQWGSNPEDAPPSMSTEP